MLTRSQMLYLSSYLLLKQFWMENTDLFVDDLPILIDAMRPTLEGGSSDPAMMTAYTACLPAENALNLETAVGALACFIDGLRARGEKGMADLTRFLGWMQADPKTAQSLYLEVFNNVRATPTLWEGNAQSHPMSNTRIF